MSQKQSEPRFTKREKLSLFIISVFLQVYGLIILGLNWHYGSLSILLIVVFGFYNVIWSWCLIHMESGFLDE